MGSTKFKLIQKTDPQTSYETHKESFLLGTSEKCEIVITGPHISEVQAKVGTKNDKYFIKNLGQNSMRVNGQATPGRFLANGDEISFGKTKLILQLAKDGNQYAKRVPLEAQTMVLDTPVGETLGPRLVCTTSSGKSRIIPLKKEKLIIGRSNEADLNLIHRSVSRKHCVIEKRNNGFTARNISTTNQLILNDHNISEKRLYTGDRLRIGTFSITFISDRSEDARTLEGTTNTKDKRPGRGLWLAGLLLLIFGSYLFYWHAYIPWKIKFSLKTVSKQIDSGKYLPAQNTLKRLLESDISPENLHEAKELLAQTTLAITHQIARNGNLEEAKEYLMAYLAEYGGGKEAEVLWERLDYYRLILGQNLESSQKYQPALRQYAAIREDSLYFEEAQKAIRRIWLAYQQERRQEQTMVQLLKEAETHFVAKRYLTPVNRNAYAVYQAVLAMEPEHELALKRIDQIKSFYREHGQAYFKKGNWLKALNYYERYSLIDPQDPDVKEKIGICRKKLTAARIKTGKSKPGKKAKNKKQNEKREEIQRLLEESGTESSWIMQYLFEEQDGEKDSEKPW